MDTSLMREQQCTKTKLAASGFAAVLLASAPLSGAFAQTTPQPATASQDANGSQPASSQPSPGDAEMMAAMEGMKPATNDIKLTGNQDHDFIVLMNGD